MNSNPGEVSGVAHPGSWDVPDNDVSYGDANAAWSGHIETGTTGNLEAVQSPQEMAGVDELSAAETSLAIMKDDDLDAACR